MAGKPRFGKLTKRSQNRIARAGEEYGLTRRQSRERYNRGTFNPLSRDTTRRIPKHAPYYPVSDREQLREAALANFDRVFALGDEWSEANRFKIVDAIEHHANDTALKRMAGASEDELRNWARYQKPYSHKGKKTPQWARTLGWYDDNGKWHNIFWYH